MTVQLTKESNGEAALLTVRDTGIGIETGALARIFEPFVHVDRSQGGLGIGLALVKGLVHLHKGEVWATSDGLGQGSEFAVRLPLTTEPSLIKSEEPALAATRLRRVLIIEDNLAAAQNLRDYLAKLGHMVEVALTGMDGIEAAHRFRPEVVLCDIGLPGLDGYAVAQALRQEPKLQGVCLIAVSGYGQKDDQQRALEVGFDQYLTKSVNLGELGRLVAGSPCDEQPLSA